MARSLNHAAVSLCILCLTGCDTDTGSQTQVLILPERLDAPHVSDQATVAGIRLVLWDDGGGCKLQVGDAPPSVWLKPMAPCYFIKSPGGKQVQVYRQNKTTGIVAVVGTPVKGNRCGQEVQGLVLKNTDVVPSAYMMQGSVYCADQGLHNFQYEFFTR